MARFTYGYFGAGLPPGYMPVGPQYEVGQAGPAGGTVVSITPGPVPVTGAQPAQTFVAPGNAPTAAVPVPGRLPTDYYPQVSVGESWASWMRRGATQPAPGVVSPEIRLTGKMTVVDLPGIGPQSVPVAIGPDGATDKPSLLPDAAGKLMLVLPAHQASNLPSVPTAAQTRAILVAEDELGLPPGLYNPEEYFPPQRAPRRTVPPAVWDRLRAKRARTGATEGDGETDMVLTAAGVYDAEGRPYPRVTPLPLRNLNTDLPSKSGVLPTQQAQVATAKTQVLTSGQEAVKASSAAADTAISPGAATPEAKPARSGLFWVAGAAALFLLVRR